MNKRNFTQNSGPSDNSDVVQLKLFTLEKLNDKINVDRNLQGVLATLQGDLVIKIGQAGTVTSVDVIDSKTGDTIANTRALAQLGKTARLARQTLETAQKNGASTKKVTLITKILHKDGGTDIKKIKPEASLRISELERKVEFLEENLERFVGLDDDEPGEKYKKFLFSTGTLALKLMRDEMVLLAIVGFEANRFEKELMKQGIPGSLYGKLTSSSLVKEDVDEARSVLFSKNKPLGNLSLTVAEILSGEVLTTVAEVSHNVYVQAKLILSLLTVIKQPIFRASPGNVYDEELMRFKFILTPKEGIHEMVENYSTATKKELQKRSFDGQTISGPITKVLTLLDAFNVSYAMAMRGQMYGPTHEEAFWPDVVKEGTFASWENTDENLNTKVGRLTETDYEIGMDELHFLAVKYALVEAGLFGNRLEEVYAKITDNSKWSVPTMLSNSIVTCAAFERLEALEIVKETVATIVASAKNEALKPEEVSKKYTDALESFIERTKGVGAGGVPIVFVMPFAENGAKQQEYLAVDFQDTKRITAMINHDEQYNSVTIAAFISDAKREVLAETVTKRQILDVARLTGVKLPTSKKSLAEKGKDKTIISGGLVLELGSDTLAVLEGAKDLEFYDEFYKEAVNWLMTCFLGSSRVQPIGARMFVSNLRNLEKVMREEDLLNDEDALDSE